MFVTTSLYCFLLKLGRFPKRERISVQMVNFGVDDFGYDADRLGSRRDLLERPMKTPKKKEKKRKSKLFSLLRCFSFFFSSTNSVAPKNIDKNTDNFPLLI